MLVELSMYDELKEQIKHHEGFRDTIYKDSLGFATIGYGHLVLPDDQYKEGETYSKEQLTDQFDEDFSKAKNQALDLIGDISLVHQAKCIIIEMVFQLGVGGVSKFKKMWEALSKGDYTEASFQMMDSRWAKQTPSRAESLSKAMNSCKT